MNTERIVLGLDVSKDTVDACLLLSDGRKQAKKFDNSNFGFHQLLCWLHGYELTQIHACLEPTGRYSRALALFLFNSGMKVSQVNSFAVQSHGRSKKFRSKSDRIDAFLLADYCLKECPPTWTPAPKAQSELRDIQHRLSCVDELIRQEENRLHAGTDSKLVLEDINESLGRLYVRRNNLETAAKQHIRADERLAANYAILNSIIGLGEKSAMRLLAMVQFEQFKTGRQVACYSGLTPRQYDSGTSVHRRAQISRVGSSELRGYLYFPAMSAMRHNPQLRAFADRLREKGKPPKSIICAVMRKLLVLATTLIHKQQLYDCAYLSPLSAVSPSTV